MAEFFARALREDARIIDEKCCLVSPCDGTVLHIGLASNSNIEQVKGVSYSLESFLGPKMEHENPEDSYTVQSVRGMYILLEDRKTSVMIPKNRYDVIIKVINNSSDHILAFGGDFSKKADGHLVCIQNIESGCSETLSYSTQAINIQGQPRKVTAASFFILNGALKQNSGLSGKQIFY